MILCLATNNAHKVEELQQLLGDTFTLKTLQEIGVTEEIPETGDTFQANSEQKARYIFERTGIATIADDSGLEVAALNNAPGVYSARYGGEHGNHAKNNEKLLLELGAESHRAARFRCVISYIDATGGLHQFEGSVEGTIARQLSGQKGFGYDPLFIPEGHTRSFAEFSAAEKNAVSHRGRAVQKLVDFLASN